eukprot:GHVQ01034154.1.p1 GENE.GHVQ01034154.1~~GHVQ01034154.1.p1  ORF type:complete len:153 (+),score=12.13 GHVQ01034154.1:442-900(+)
MFKCIYVQINIMPATVLIELTTKLFCQTFAQYMGYDNNSYIQLLHWGKVYLEYESTFTDKLAEHNNQVVETLGRQFSLLKANLPHVAPKLFIMYPRRKPGTYVQFPKLTSGWLCETSQAEFDEDVLTVMTAFLRADDYQSRPTVIRFTHSHK